MGRVAGVALRIAVVAAVVAAGVAWIATSRSVILRVDGVTTTVRSHASDVRGVLSVAGVKPGARDEVVPELDAEVRDGDTVLLNRARLVTLTVDGRTWRQWVTARTVAEVLDDLRMRGARLRLSASRSSRMPIAGGALRVETEKAVLVTADGRRTGVVTFASTVDDLLAERGLTLDGDDRVVPERTASLAGVAAVTVRRIMTRTRVETVPLPAPVQTRRDPELMLDQRRVVTTGRAGRERRTVRLVYADGRVVETAVESRGALAAASPRVEVVGSRPYPADDTGLNWAALAQCESGGNPRAVSSAGTYHGLYQFNVEMWQRMGGIGLPSEATPREQTYRAIRLYQAAGAGQWPVCGSRLFS